MARDFVAGGDYDGDSTFNSPAIDLQPELSSLACHTTRI